MADRMETTVRRKPLGVVDQVVPMFQEHAADMADREASVVRLERVVLLELENEDGHADDGRGTRGSRKRVKDSRSEGSDDDGRGT
jgi:sirohydrochlorin ferrochelatase